MLLHKKDMPKNELAKVTQFRVLKRFAKGLFALGNVDKEMIPGPGFLEKAVVSDGLEKQYINQ